MFIFRGVFGVIDFMWNKTLNIWWMFRDHFGLDLVSKDLMWKIHWTSMSWFSSWESVIAVCFPASLKNSTRWWFQGSPPFGEDSHFDWYFSEGLKQKPPPNRTWIHESILRNKQTSQVWWLAGECPFISFYILWWYVLFLPGTNKPLVGITIRFREHRLENTLDILQRYPQKVAETNTSKAITFRYPLVIFC